MSAPSPNSCPFIAGPTIDDPKYFIGRDAQLNDMKDRMTAPQPTSISLVGEHRIGKSSLLYRFFQYWNPDRFPPRGSGGGVVRRFAQLLKLGKKRPPYAVIYLDLQDATCQTQAGFYRAIATAAKDHPIVEQYGQHHHWQRLWQNTTLDGMTFAKAVKACKEGGVLLVLCLDKFDALFQHPEEFDNGFYDSLHSLINHSHLMLIVATLKNLEVYRQEQTLTSSFFNVGHVLKLEEFTPAEAAELVKLPKGSAALSVEEPKPALIVEDQEKALQWGGRHPYRLQLAGYCLWQARQQDKDIPWAKAKFDSLLNNGIQPQDVIKNWDWRHLKTYLSRFIWIHNVINLSISQMIGVGITIMVIGAIISAMLGIISWSEVLQRIKNIVCSTLSSNWQNWCNN
ncbi:MAG TPA: AAA-like domain-containing protein [Oscillatoriaceae cyanobacterium M33_DOE_052]|nr:AAA-like domain-containing protein [Oscillatoriaceae cyanobacterium M33_DOE_052]